MNKEPKYIVTIVFNLDPGARKYTYLVSEEFNINEGDYVVVDSNFTTFKLTVVKVIKIDPFHKTMLKKHFNYKYIKAVIPNNQRK